MESIIRFGSSSNIYSNLPAWMQDNDLFSGRLYTANGKSGKLVPSGSGKVVASDMHSRGVSRAQAGARGTNDILRALARAIMVHTGCDKDAYGYNDSFAVAEVTDSDKFDVGPNGSTVGSGAKVCMAIGLEGESRKKIYMSVNNSRAQSKDVHTWYFLFTLMGYYMTNEEFSKNFLICADENSGREERVTAAAICCDIVYYMTNGLGITLADKSAVLPITSALKGAKLFSPDMHEGVFTEFTIGASSGKNTSCTGNAFIEAKDWNGRYRLLPEEFFTQEELAHVPVLDDSFVITQEMDDMAKMISWSLKNGSDIKFRDVLLRGKPGTGKSTFYHILAAAFALPLYTHALNAMSEPMDLVGSFVPVSRDKAKPSENVPSVSDMLVDPVNAYKEITGIEDANATEESCLTALVERIKNESNGHSDNETKTRVEFIPGIIPHMARPCVIGLDEISMPMNAGVVPVLHPLMDSTNAYTLPTGEVIHRHPFSILVSTTNLELEGNRSINQAFMDRCSYIKDIDEPDESEIRQRLIANTGFDQSKYPNLNLDMFMRAYKDMKGVAEARRLTDGVIGPRQLSAWLMQSMFTGKPRAAASTSIIPGGTCDKEGQRALQAKVDALFTI